MTDPIQQSDLGGYADSGTTYGLNDVSAGSTQTLFLIDIGGGTAGGMTVGSDVVTGNTWVQRAFSAIAGFDIEVWTCEDSEAGDARPTITTSSGSQFTAYSAEWDGTLKFISAGSAGNVGTTAASLGLTVTNGDVAQAAVIAGQGSSTLDSGPSSPWTDYNAGVWILAFGADTAYATATSGGTLTPAWVATSDGWDEVGVVLGVPSAPTDGSFFF